MIRRAQIRINGRVQGVCFRMYACDEATRLGLTGWVRNNHDGSVEAVAEGEDAALREFVEWCRAGPPSARVINIDVEYSAPTDEFGAFTVTC